MSPLEPEAPRVPGGAPDSFGSAPGAPVVTDPNTGISWALGFGPGSPPTVIYVAVTNWQAAKAKWTTWADAKLAAPTWAIAKAVVSS